MKDRRYLSHQPDPPSTRKEKKCFPLILLSGKDGQKQKINWGTCKTENREYNGKAEKAFFRFPLVFFSGKDDQRKKMKWGHVHRSDCPPDI